jgi:hypothetical protein
VGHFDDHKVLIRDGVERQELPLIEAAEGGFVTHTVSHIPPVWSSEIDLTGFDTSEHSMPLRCEASYCDCEFLIDEAVTRGNTECGITKPVTEKLMVQLLEHPREGCCRF